MNRDARWRELIDFILMMARRDDVWSVSCQFSDQRLWEGLLGEQIKRSQQTGLPLQEAYFLSGPDGGMHGIAKNHAGLEDRPEDQWYDGTTLEETMGGEIHIPCEGVCGADLFVYPDWRVIYPEAWEVEGAMLHSATARRPCNHLLIEKKLKEPRCATRYGPIAGTWWLYSSKGPRVECNPHRF